VAKYLTNYGKLSDAGKQMLFEGRPDLAKAMDDLTTLSGRYKASEALANVSKSAPHVEALGMLFAALSGHFLPVLKTLGGGALGAAVLSRPATVRALTRWAKLYGLAATAPRLGYGALNVAAKRFAAEIGLHYGLGPSGIAQLAKALAGGGQQTDQTTNGQVSQQSQ
jgi:hypothetical protein